MSRAQSKKRKDEQHFKQYYGEESIEFRNARFSVFAIASLIQRSRSLFLLGDLYSLSAIYRKNLESSQIHFPTKLPEFLPTEAEIGQLIVSRFRIRNRNGRGKNIQKAKMNDHSIYN